MDFCDDCTERLRRDATSRMCRDCTEKWVAHENAKRQLRLVTDDTDAHPDTESQAE